MIKLIVFLGNRGREYEKTRHNVGFLLSDYLYPNMIWTNKFHSFFAKDGGVFLLKPLTLMNLSGIAVSECASFFKLRTEEILVVSDDMELPLGEMREQKGGGTKGHNGIKNIRDRLGSENFYRLRIGIGRPKYGDSKVYVLSPFTQNEVITLSSLFSLIKREWPLIGKEKKWSI